MIRIMKYTICLLAISMIAGLSSCSLFGLDYQFNYENEAAPVTTELNMTCYEFIRSRSNADLVLMYEAINRAEMQEFYETDNLTYFLLDDEEFASWLTTKKYASVASVPKSELQTMLKGYTLPGLYHSADLTTSPIDVLTCNGVLSIRLRLYPNPPTSSQDLNAMQAGYVNEDGTVNYSKCHTTNLRPTNGIAHLLHTRFLAL